MAQEGSGHLREDRLHEIEPRAVLGGMDVLEAPRAACQVGHRLLGGVGAVVVQYDADDRLARIVLMQAFEQGDELATAVARLDVGDDLARPAACASWPRWCAGVGRLARAKARIECLGVAVLAAGACPLATRG